MRSFLRSLTQNWKLKLLAFALAVLLWVVVTAEQVTSNWIPLPLQVRVADPDFRLVEGSVPTEVEVRFSGPGRELWDLVIRRPPLVLAVDDVSGTEDTFELDPRMVRVPTQLSATPVDVRPGSVSLDFRRVESRVVSVRPRVARGPGQGWVLVDSLQITPDRIRISGLAGDLEGIGSVATLPVLLDGGDSIFARVVPLDTAGYQGVRFSATRVRVAGQMERMLERSFPDMAVTVAEGTSIQPATVDVRVLGAASRIRAMDPEGFRVVMAVDSVRGPIPPEGVVVPLRADRLPAGLRAQISPSAVRLLPDRSEMEPGAGPEEGIAIDTARVRR